MYRMPILIVAALLFAAGAQAADPTSLDGWPDWVKEDMQKEVRRLKFKTIETPDGKVSVKLPGKTARPEPYEDTWFFSSEFKAGVAMTCYAITASRDLATLANVVAESNIGSVAPEGTLRDRYIHYIDTGEVAGIPWLALEWLYTVQGEEQLLIGFTKVRVAGKGQRAFACGHNTLGYRDSFERAFNEFVSSAAIASDEAEPFYEEIAQIKMNMPGAGFAYTSYNYDEDGDIRMYLAESALMPVDAATLTTNDDYTISYTDPDGNLINSISIMVENGELTGDLSLSYEEERGWVSAGKLQGKEVDFAIGTEVEPTSEWQQLAIARDLFGGDAATATVKAWVPGVDPSSLLDATMTRDDAEVERQAIMQLGPLRYTGRFAESGNLVDAVMNIGPVSMHIERIWSRGSLQQ